MRMAGPDGLAKLESGASWEVEESNRCIRMNSLRGGDGHAIQRTPGPVGVRPWR